MASFINASIEYAKQIEENDRLEKMGRAQEAIAALIALGIPGLSAETLKPEFLPVITEKGNTTYCAAISCVEHRAVDDEILKHRCVLAAINQDDPSTASARIYFKLQIADSRDGVDPWWFSILALKKDVFYCHIDQCQAANLLGYTGDVLSLPFDRMHFQYYPARAR